MNEDFSDNQRLNTFIYVAFSGFYSLLVFSTIKFRLQNDKNSLYFPVMSNFVCRNRDGDSNRCSKPDRDNINGCRSKYEFKTQNSVWNLLGV